MTLGGAGALDAVVRRHKAGEAIGVTSVCSAHPLVLEAAMVHARDAGGDVLIEATSNQVDQDGGYTGLRPADFRDLVTSTAQRCGLPPGRIVLGGDHLGPNRWRHLPAEEAMAHADRLVEAYVEAGFTKIHLDCSFVCAGDPAPLTDELVSERAARLVRVAEAADRRRGPGGRLRYVIGTEVPVPGGAQEDLAELVPTDPAAARATLAVHRAAFEAAGVGEVWSQVVALVVQPGVEFDHLRVVEYRPERTTGLRAVLDDQPGMVLEAHSTDYQRPSGLRALVEDHWAVLKVGPALTFALREALFALEAIEAELVDDEQASHLPAVVEAAMLADPGQWAGYYHGDEREQRLARRYSFSDRIRYYWPQPGVEAATERLLANLRSTGMPLPLLSQHLPQQYERVREGLVSTAPDALVTDHVGDVLRAYAHATKEHT